MLAIDFWSSDEELDDHVNAVSASWIHVGGTASMGKVVDTQYKVDGIQRGVDCSIMPLSISAHLQASIYGIATAANLIARDCVILGIGSGLSILWNCQVLSKV